MPLTVLICANCEVISELSIGFSGSWFFNCVTSNVMKLLCRSALVLWLPLVWLSALSTLESMLLLAETVISLLPG